MNNSLICVDASLVVRLFIDPQQLVIRQLWGQWDAEKRPLAAPTLIHYEVTNALYRCWRQGLLSASAVRLAQQTALALPLVLYGDASLHQSALEMAARLSLPAAYDAHYLALAETLGAEFWTADQRLVRAVGDALPWVHATEE